MQEKDSVKIAAIDSIQTHFVKIVTDYMVVLFAGIAVILVCIYYCIGDKNKFSQYLSTINNIA